MQRKPKQAAGEHSDPRDGRLPCQLHLDLVASVKLLTELTTLAALVAIAGESGCRRTRRQAP